MGVQHRNGVESISRYSERKTCVERKQGIRRERICSDMLRWKHACELIVGPPFLSISSSTKFREGVYGKGAYQQEQYRDLIGMGIFNSNPPLWKHQRKCAAPLFTTAALKSHGQPLRAVGQPIKL